MSNYNLTLQSNNTDLQAILNTINELPEAGSGGTQATPVISVNSSNGLIAATAGTKTSTHQLAFQPAKTITPTTASQIAVSSGYYTGGNITVAGDSNLVASNIKSGVSIFGVSGTLEESGMSGGEQVEWSANEDAIINRTIRGQYANDRLKTIGVYAFFFCSNLTTVNFPVCTTIGDCAFSMCYDLTEVSFPACTKINSGAFFGCTSLSTVVFPSCTTIGSSAFGTCINLTTVSFPACTTIGSSAFDNCWHLTRVSFPVCTTINTYAFNTCSLTTVSFPACTTIGSYAFYRCSNLTTVNFPVCTTINHAAFAVTGLTTASFPTCKTIGSSAFSICYSLTTASFPSCTTIDRYAFQLCKNFKSLYLTGSSLCTLSNSNAFVSTPFAGYSASFSGTPYIYVPASLVDVYKTATNWTYFSKYISAIEGRVEFGDQDVEELPTFQFTIYDEDHKTALEVYDAEEGMTWGEWVNSDYNTGGYYINDIGEITKGIINSDNDILVITYAILNGDPVIGWGAETINVGSHDVINHELPTDALYALDITDDW